MPICLRCGQCCHFIENGKLVACKFLMKKEGRFHCSVFNIRFQLKDEEGKPICIKRKNVRFDFPGCPYNTGKPLFRKNMHNPKSISEKGNP
jgi:hypothetical protein